MLLFWQPLKKQQRQQKRTKQKHLLGLFVMLSASNNRILLDALQCVRVGSVCCLSMLFFLSSSHTPQWLQQIALPL